MASDRLSHTRSSPLCGQPSPTPPPIQPALPLGRPEGEGKILHDPHPRPGLLQRRPADAQLQLPTPLHLLPPRWCAAQRPGKPARCSSSGKPSAWLASCWPNCRLSNPSNSGRPSQTIHPLPPRFQLRFNTLCIYILIFGDKSLSIKSGADLERRPVALLGRSSSPGYQLQLPGYQPQLPGYQPQLGRSSSHNRPAQPRMGRLESVQEASTASLPRCKELEGTRWKSEEWERDEEFLSMIATRLSTREPRQEVTEL